MTLHNGRVDLGLILSLLGSLMSLPLNKRYHVGLGLCFAVLTGIHTWQHRRHLSHYLQKERPTMGFTSLYKRFLDPANKAAYLLQHVQVLHYIPGRVRLYSRHLVNNPEVARQVFTHLKDMPEIKDFSVNPATGSVLIQYSPEGVFKNPLLRELEQLVAKQKGR